MRAARESAAPCSTSLLEQARADGYGALSLSVDRDNEGAIALYEQFGFGRVDETDDSLTLRAALA